MKKLTYVGLIIAICVALAIIPSPSERGFAQSNARLIVTHVDDIEYPEIKIYVSAIDGKGKLISNIPIEDFIVFEDGNKVQLLSLKVGPNKHQALSVLLAIDITDRYSSFPQIIALTKEFINNLPQIDRLALAVYSSEYQQLLDFTRDKVQAIKSFDSITQKGNSTALFDSIEKSINLLKYQPEPRILLLLGNGQESKISKKNIDDVIQLANTNHIQIFALGYGSLVYKEVLDKLAESTGGKTYYLQQKEEYEKELKEGYKKLLDGLMEVKNQYILTYRSSLPSDGTQHELKVDINHQGWQTSHEGSMIACAGILKLCLPSYMPEKTIGMKTCIAPNIYSPEPPVEKLEVIMDGQMICSITSPPFECCLPPDVKEGQHNFEITVQDSPFEPARLLTSLTLRPNMRIEVNGPDSIQRSPNTIPYTLTINALNPLAKIIIKIDDNQIDEIVQIPPPRSRFPYIYVVPLNVPATKLPLGEHRLIIQPIDEKNVSYEGEKGIYVQNVGDTSTEWVWWLLGIIFIFGASFYFVRRRQPKASSAILRELQGMNVGQEWGLSSEQVTLGRKGSDNDIPLSGLSASRYMARISFEDGKHIIRSLKIENPVLVNNQPVQLWELQPGDQIKAGDSIFIYELKE